MKTHADSILYGDEELILNSVLEEWSTDKSRGMVALVGDYASGKSQLLKRISSAKSEVIKSMHLPIGKRLLDRDNAHKWVCRNFGIDVACEDMELIQGINEMDGMLITVDDLHYSSFRDVGGYDALRYILRLMQATSHKHFWLVTFHAHTWDFLEGAAAPVNLSVFRKTVYIKPLTYMEMSNWLKTRVDEAGFSLNFNRLAPQDASEKTISRAEIAYWRLLVDETGGNQSVAEQFFLEAMSKGKLKDELEIGLFDSPSESELLNLVDLERFVLMSILIHDGLGVELLCKTLNEKMDLVETACRHLVGLGICFWHEDVLQVELTWRPQVLRTLKKQRLLYAG